jgi:hypothetical protein
MAFIPSALFSPNVFIFRLLDFRFLWIGAAHFFDNFFSFILKYQIISYFYLLSVTKTSEVYTCFAMLHFVNRIPKKKMYENNLKFN